MRSIIISMILVCCVLSIDAQTYSYKGGRDSNTGLTRVKNNAGKYGYIDDTGTEIIPTKYDELGDFGDGKRLAVAKYYGKYGYLKPNGQMATEFKYDIALSFDWDNRLAPVATKKVNGEYVFGYINLSGTEVIPIKYEIAMPFCDGLAAVCMGDKYGFINEEGTKVIDYQYDDVEWGFYEGYAWVKKNGKWGLIDKKGIGLQVANNFQFTRLLNFDYYEGWADAMTATSKTFYFDKYGKSYTTSEERKRANEKIVLELATIDWKDVVKETTQPTFNVKAGVKSTSKIEKITVTVEGQRGIKNVDSDDYDAKINENVTLNEGPNKIIIAVTNAAGTAKVEKTVTYRTVSLPTIEWNVTATTVKQSTYQVLAKIKSKSRIEDVYVLVNDERNSNRSIKVVVADNFDMSLNRTVTLSEGTNTIKIFARNEAGAVTSVAKTVVYEKEKIVVQTERRLALVMGNANYKNVENRLKNPVNDASDFANKLESLGFDVIRAFDKDKQGMELAVANFGKRANNYDVALFFYAGHGIQSDKINYLVPVDANLNSEAEVEFKCVPADLIVKTLTLSKSPMKIAIFDACRNNPWERAWHRALGNRGFTGIEPPAGMIIAFSTAAGSVASDGKNKRNSPYMTAILKTLDIPGLSLLDFFQEVSADVQENTNPIQSPWIQNSLGRGKFYFNKRK